MYTCTVYTCSLELPTCDFSAPRHLRVSDCWETYPGSVPWSSYQATSTSWLAIILQIPLTFHASIANTIIYIVDCCCPSLYGLSFLLHYAQNGSNSKMLREQFSKLQNTEEPFHSSMYVCRGIQFWDKLGPVRRTMRKIPEVFQPFRDVGNLLLILLSYNYRICQYMDKFFTGVRRLNVRRDKGVAN